MHDSKARKSKVIQNADTADEGMCAGQAMGYPLRADLGFLAIEDLTIDVFRCLCEVYGTGAGKPMDIAMAMAEEHLGSENGPLLVARTTALLRALRMERNVGFTYLSVGCRHIAPDELAIMGMVKSARVREFSTMERAMSLALGPSCSCEKTRTAANGLASFQQRFVDGFGRQDDQDNSAFEGQIVQAVYLH